MIALSRMDSTQEMSEQCIDVCAGTIQLPASHREVARRAAILITFLSAVMLCVQMKSTSLHHAAEQGHFEVVELLLKHGATVSLRNKVSIEFLCIEIILQP